MFRRTFSAPLRRAANSIYRQQVRHFDDEFASQKSTLNLLSREEDAGILIEAYSPLGFRLSNNIRIFGPCAIFPRSILHWNVTSVEDINEDSLSLFGLLEPKLDLLILGLGSSTANINMSVIQYLRSRKIGVEILPTEHACSTFNFLNAEHRCVAAALIPPEYASIQGSRGATRTDGIVTKDMMEFQLGIFDVEKDTEEEKRLTEKLYGENNENLWKQWYSNKRRVIHDESDKHDPNEYLRQKEKPPSDQNK